MHTEDLELTRSALVGIQRQVEIVPTADVLPPEAERLRRGIRRRQPAHWARRVTKRPTAWAGWFVQQLTKLAATAACDSQTVVILDSDVLPTDRWAEADFLCDGRSIRYESATQDAEMAAWVIKAMDFLGVARQRTPLVRHTHCPAVLDARVTADLLRFVETRENEAWYLALARHDIFEYAAYGVFAGHLDAAARTVPHEPMPGLLISFEDDEVACPEPPGRVRYVSIQSRLRRPADESARLWRQYVDLA